MKKCKFFSTVLLSIALFLTTVLQQPLQSHAEEARVKSDAYQEEFMDFTGSALRCAYHSQSEIVAFMKSHPTQYLSGYSVEPSTTAPYAIGRPTDAVLQDALNTLNAIRYVAGLPGNVRLNEEYYQKTQAGALINAVNGGLSHSPSQPSDMSDELYNLAYSGASSSNLSSGRSNLASAIIGGWMADTSGSNRRTLGHRRWILSPSMGSTWFGQVAAVSSMYCFDYEYVFYKNSWTVAWPAQNTPTEFFKASHPWSLSTGTIENADNVRVKVTNLATGQVWNFYQGCTDGDFFVNNTNYGVPGCIIFCPPIETVAHGDSYRVEITGLADVTKDSVSYTVNFFDAEQVEPSTPSTEQDEEGVRAFVDRLYSVILDREPDETGAADWTRKLLSGEKTGAEVAKGFIMSTEFTSRNYKNDDFLKKLYSAFFDREPDASGYSTWMARLNAGTSRYAVLTGFTNSNEFGNLCARFGITRGTLPEETENPATPTPEPSQSEEEELLRIDSTGVNRDDIESYVARIYRKVLHRAPDDAGLAYWTDAIMNGSDANGKRYDPATVIRTGFFTSKEYTILSKSDEDFLTDVYMAFFDREPDEDGYNKWLGELKAGTQTRDSVIAHGFGHSKEFKILLTGYGFKVED